MDNYSVSLAWSEEDGGYIAIIPELRNVSAFGETAEEAVAEVKIAAEAYLETCEARGLRVPKPIKRTIHSGQLRLRMPATLHENLAVMAQSENVSLNQLIVSLLSEAYGLRRGAGTLPSDSRTTPGLATSFWRVAVSSASARDTATALQADSKATGRQMYSHLRPDKFQTKEARTECSPT